MHGIASEAVAMEELAEWIRARYPGIYVKNLEVRSLLVNGFFSSIFMSLNEQVENVCKQLERDRNLENGFDLIGFSQGTQVTRGYLERCNSPQVRNWISLAGVNGGLFGEGMIPAVVDKALHKMPFDDWVQRTFTWAQMWKDPFDLPLYRNASEFMADVSNDRADKNPAYRANIIKLEHAVLFYSPNDDVIRPQAAGWFEFYRAGQDRDITPLKDSEGYLGDWLGLRTLAEAGRLVQYRSGCLHVEHVGRECKAFVEERIMPFLGNGGNSTRVIAEVRSRRG
jgi:palmitoyl-protein thioesterase